MASEVIAASVASSGSDVLDLSQQLRAIEFAFSASSRLLPAARHVAPLFEGLERLRAVIALLRNRRPLGEQLRPARIRPRTSTNAPVMPRRRWTAPSCARTRAPRPRRRRCLRGTVRGPARPSPGRLTRHRPGVPRRLAPRVKLVPTRKALAHQSPAPIGRRCRYRCLSQC